MSRVVNKLCEELSTDIEKVAEEMYSIFMNTILPKLGTINDESKRYLYFIAWLSTELEKRGLGRIIITGGFAVEIYTGRVYRTMDVDIIIEGEKARNIIEVFLKMFSDRIGRGYLPKYEILQLKSIDIVSTVYSKAVEPTKILVNESYVYMEVVEELIISYLSGWKFWNATEDRDKALWLYIVWKDKLDIDYLERRAREENVFEYLSELRELALRALSLG